MLSISPVSPHSLPVQDSDQSRQGLPLGRSIESFAEIFNTTEKAVAGFAVGRVDAQSVVEALSEAELALQTAVTVRDRLVGAYQELLRMPL